MVEAELFDGTVLEFPDGTPPEVIQRVAKEQTALKQSLAPAAAPQAAAATPAAEPSLVDQIMGYADNAAGLVAQGLRGARTGMAAVAGLPVDIVNNAPRVANLLPGVEGVGPISQQPFLGSDYIDAAMGGFGAIPDVSAPDGAAERFVRRVGQEIGGAAVPVGGALAAAGRVGVQGARELPALARMFVEPAAVAPGRFVGKETAIATGAGMGAGAANLAVDPNTTGGQAADIAGALAGAGLTAAGRGLVNAARDVGAATLGNSRYASDVVQQNVADQIIQNSDVLGRRIDPAAPDQAMDTGPLIDAIMRPSAAEAVIPGYRASTADRAGDAGVALLENARARANPGPARARADENARAVDTAVQQIAPTEQPGAFRAALEEQTGARMAAASQAEAAAQQRFTDAVARLEPSMSGEGRGSTIRDALEEAKAAARDIEREAYPNLSGVQANVSPLAASINDYVGGLSRAEREVFVPSQASIPDEIVQAAARAAGEGVDPSALQVPTNMREVTGLRSVLNARLREASAGQRVDEARVLRGLLDRIDGFLDDVLPAELRTQDARAREVSRALNDTFTRRGTPVAGALRRGENATTYPTSNDTVAPRFVQPDERNASALRDVRATVGGFEATNPRLPEVDAALQDQVRANVRRFRDNPDQLARYAQENRQALDTYPELRAEIDTAIDAGRQAAATAEARVATERDIKSGPAGRYLQYSDANADRAMREVLNAKDPGQAMDQLLATAGSDPRAMEGAKAAFWKNMDAEVRAKNANAETASGTMPIVGRKLVNFLDNPATAEVAARLYKDNPEHLDRLREIGAALREVNLGSRVGNSVNPSGTALLRRGEPAVTLAEAQSKIYQAQIGRANPLYIVTYLAGKAARTVVGRQQARSFEMLLDRALTDPDLAARLLADNNPANRAALARDAKGWLGNEAATFVDMLTSDDDETKGAIMGTPPRIMVHPNGQ